MLMVASDVSTNLSLPVLSSISISSA
jgi:hypothetical protein